MFTVLDFLHLLALLLTGYGGWMLVDWLRDQFRRNRTTQAEREALFLAQYQLPEDVQ